MIGSIFVQSDGTKQALNMATQVNGCNKTRNATGARAAGECFHSWFEVHTLKLLRVFL